MSVTWGAAGLLDARRITRRFDALCSDASGLPACQGVALAHAQAHGACPMTLATGVTHAGRLGRGQRYRGIGCRGRRRRQRRQRTQQQPWDLRNIERGRACVWKFRGRGKGSWQHPSFCAFGAFSLWCKIAGSKQYQSAQSQSSATATAAHRCGRALGCCTSCKQDSGVPYVVIRECCSVCICMSSCCTDGGCGAVACDTCMYHYQSIAEGAAALQRTC